MKTKQSHNTQRQTLIASILLGGMLVLASQFPSNAEAGEPIVPLPTSANIDPIMAQLGEKLFKDKSLSSTGKISCVSCHHLDQSGDDGRVVSTGVKGRKGVINTPSVFNSAYNFVLFWNGRAKSLEEQINGPINNQVEMGNNWQQVVSTLKADPYYPQLFNALFSDGITPHNIRRAIADFERTLITPNSPFDQYLRGDISAINEYEAGGYQLFKDYGCATCHQGQLIGGNMYGKMGVIGNYFADRGNITKADDGRYEWTQLQRHRHQFKVPSLRNVSTTAPYFHDGTVTDLYQAVRIMAKYQLGRQIPPGDVAQIVAFLQTLTAPLAQTKR